MSTITAPKTNGIEQDVFSSVCFSSVCFSSVCFSSIFALQSRADYEALFKGHILRDFTGARRVLECVKSELLTAARGALEATSATRKLVYGTANLDWETGEKETGDPLPSAALTQGAVIGYLQLQLTRERCESTIRDLEPVIAAMADAKDAQARAEYWDAFDAWLSSSPLLEAAYTALSVDEEIDEHDLCQIYTAWENEFEDVREVRLEELFESFVCDTNALFHWTLRRVKLDDLIWAMLHALPTNL